VRTSARMLIVLSGLVIVGIISAALVYQLPVVTEGQRDSYLKNCEQNYPGASYVAYLDLKTGKVECFYGSLRSMESR
jgi:hypothetical protein